MRRLACLAVAGLFISLPATAQPDNWQLVREKTEARLREIAGETRGVLGFAAVDLTSGERFGVNENLVFPQGSAIKVPILIEVYKQAGEGKFQLTDRLPEITAGLNSLAQSRGLGLAVLMVTDVVRGSSRLVLAGPAMARLDDLPYERLPDGTLHARDVVSRKKQLLPAILGLVD